jgi:tRNA_anti-like
MSGKKKIFIAVLLIVAAIVIYVYKEYNRTNINISEEESAFNVEAVDLIKAFADNDSAAAHRYVGKVISVTGLVKNLDKDERGYYTVSLGDTASLSSVRCSVDSMYTTRASAAKPGTTIKIKGNCTGYNADELLGLDVIVNRCVIEPN